MICKGIKLTLAQPEGRFSFKFIIDYHPVNTIVTTNLTNNVVVVNETFFSKIENLSHGHKNNP